MPHRRILALSCPVEMQRAALMLWTRVLVFPSQRLPWWVGLSSFHRAVDLFACSASLCISQLPSHWPQLNSVVLKREAELFNFVSSKQIRQTHEDGKLAMPGGLRSCDYSDE